jgi:hypothetical protein
MPLMPEGAEKGGRPAQLDGARLREVAAEIEREFPSVTRRTALVLFEVDPDHLQAQWQLVPDDLREAQDAFPAGASAVRPQVRLAGTGPRKDDSPAPVYLPEAVSGDAFGGTASFRVPERAGEYVAELGVTSAEGGWLLLARSNRVRPPSPVGDAVPPAAAAALTGPERTLPAGSGGNATRVPTLPESAAEPFRRRDEAPPGDFDPTLQDSGIRLPPVFPNPARRSGWAPVAPFLCVITALAPPGQGFPSVPLPVPASSGAPSGERSAFSPSVHGDGVRAAATDEVQASSPPGPDAGVEARDLPDFPSYDPSAAVSSHALAGRGEGRARLELRVELLVYGEAEPGSLVRLFGQDLRVGPGGRFFLRRLLESPALEGMPLAASAPLASEGLESE